MPPRSLALLCLLSAAGVAISACSSRSWYEGGKQSALSECRQKPPAMQEDCRARVNSLSYEEYERQRNKKP